MDYFDQINRNDGLGLFYDRREVICDPNYNLYEQAYPTTRNALEEYQASKDFNES